MDRQDCRADVIDPCATLTVSISRLAVLTSLFLTLIGSMVMLAALNDRPYGIQLSSIVMDTAAVALYTFSSNRNNLQRFLLSCPVVRRQVPQLIRRHLGFLVVLLLLETTALVLRPTLPAYWMRPIGKTDPSLFAVVLSCTVGCIATIQIISNRSLLERAHVSTETP